MTVARNPWPSDPVDKFMLERMVRSALSVEHHWKPPARYAFTIDEWDLVDFENPLSRMQNHVTELWDALPALARVLYYLQCMSDGLGYVLLAAILADRKAGVSHEHVAGMRAAVEAAHDHMHAMITAAVDAHPCTPALRQALLGTFPAGDVDPPPATSVSQILRPRERVVDLDKPGE